MVDKQIIWALVFTELKCDIFWVFTELNVNI